MTSQDFIQVFNAQAQNVIEIMDVIQMLGDQVFQTAQTSVTEKRHFS